MLKSWAGILNEADVVHMKRHSCVMLSYKRACHNTRHQKWPLVNQKYKFYSHVLKGMYAYFHKPVSIYLSWSVMLAAQ